MSEAVRRADRAGVAVLTLAGAQAGVAWSAGTQESYHGALAAAASDREVRAVVVTGAGSAFCHGATGPLPDLIPGEPTPGRNARVEGSLVAALDFPKPLVAAINGAATGAGLVQALLADVRIAARSAVLGTASGRRHLAAEQASAWLLTQVAGRGVALDLLLSGREVAAADALRLGLVHRVVADDELLDVAVEQARSLAVSSSPASMAAIKHQVNTQAAMTLRQAERASRVLIDESLAGPDFEEGISGFLERRPPRFAPLGEGTRFTVP